MPNTWNSIKLIGFQMSIVSTLRNPGLVEYIFVVCNYFYIKLRYSWLYWYRNSFHEYLVLIHPGSLYGDRRTEVVYELVL